MRAKAILGAAGVALGTYATLFRAGSTWGATATERRHMLPGDELLARPTMITTHGVTIDLPPEQVWPWLVQMGWGRAGWYTYRWVDRLLFPANGPSATRIRPELQQLAVGDRVPDGPPETDCWFTVEQLDRQVMVLRSTRHLPLSWRQRGAAMQWVWSWHLDSPTAGRTRLLQRNRMWLRPRWLETVFLALIVPADFIMARSHLLAIKQRAEASARSPGVEL